MVVRAAMRSAAWRWRRKYAERTISAGRVSVGKSSDCAAG